MNGNEYKKFSFGFHQIHNDTVIEVKRIKSISKHKKIKEFNKFC